MKKFRELKKQARTALKPGYSRAVSVCFLLAVLTGTYPFSTAFLNIYYLFTGNAAAVTAEDTTSEIVTETTRNLFSGTPFYTVYRDLTSGAVNNFVDLYTGGYNAAISFLRTVNSLFAEALEFRTVFLILGVLLSVLYEVFISNMLKVGERRYFLEARKYTGTPISKVFFLYKLRALYNPARVMFFRSLYQFLWNFTIVGGIYKHYEYILIPYITAENPAIDKKDAFYLSRELMNGHKRQLFLLHLSFIGWKILSVLTLGIADTLYVNPYLRSTEAEFYMQLRREYVLSRAPKYECFNDRYLERVLSDDELLISKAIYDDSEGPYTKVNSFSHDQYPVYLFSLQPPFSVVHIYERRKQTYDVWSYVFLFYAFSLTGRILETLARLFRDGTLPEYSGVFTLWLPLYGVFGVLTLFIFRRHKDRPIILFLTDFALYTVIEYGFSKILQQGLGIGLRTASQYFLNLNGKTFISNAVLVALLGCAFFYFLAPIWNAAFKRLKTPARIVICAVLTVLFAADIFFL